AFHVTGVQTCALPIFLIDGKPLTDGYIRFVPTDSRVAGGNIDNEGRFKLTCIKEGDGVVIGNHRVEIVGTQPVSDTHVKWLAPKRYAYSNTSGLTCNVTGPTDDATFNLTWDGGAPFVEYVGDGAEGDSRSAY